MKKYIYLTVTTISLLASCSSGNEDLTNNSQTLSPVTITASASATSRAVWSSAGTSGNIYVSFEPGDQMDVFELDGTSVIKHTFTNNDAGSYQSGNFKGTWNSNLGHWAAILPSNTSNNVQMISGDSQYNLYTLNLPTSQQTVLRTVEGSDLSGNPTYNVSPDKSANIMIGAKNSHTTTTCFLAPVCAYLYFYTPLNISEVTISAVSVNTRSSVGAQKEACMAGTVTAKTVFNTAPQGQWDSWDNFVKCISDITTSSTTKSITVSGVNAHHKVNNAEVNEYIACIYAGAYTGLQISYTDSNNTKHTKGSQTKINTFETVNCYYLGGIE